METIDSKSVNTVFGARHPQNREELGRELAQGKMPITSAVLDPSNSNSVKVEKC